MLQRLRLGKDRHAHERQFGICSCGNDFRRRVSVRGIVNFILYDLEEFLRFWSAWIIVSAGGIEIKELPIENFLAGADVADALQKLAPIIAAACLFQQFVVHGKAFDEIFTQHTGRPAPELRSTQGFHAISDRNDHVKAVEGNRFVGMGNVQKLHIAFFVNLAFRDSVIDMPSDDRPVSLEQFSHLCLREPDSFVFHADVNTGFPVFCLIHDNFRFI